MGCTVGSMAVNHLMFVNDICVLSPKYQWTPMFSVENVCGDHATDHEIAFICNKTFFPKKV